MPLYYYFHEVHFKSETESRLAELASKSGRAPDDLVEDALAGYLAEVAGVREMLDGRYDEIKNGQVKRSMARLFLKICGSVRTICWPSEIEMIAGQGFKLHPGAASDITSIWEFIAEG